MYHRHEINAFVVGFDLDFVRIIVLLRYKTDLGRDFTVKPFKTYQICAEYFMPPLT